MENLNRYSIFLKVAETGSITRAAEILNYTQSGISHAIAAMEREAGCQLFLRKKTGVLLTENGREILPYIRSVVQSQSELSEYIYTLHHQISGTIRIGLFTSVSVIIMPKLIQSFHEKHPDVKFVMRFGTCMDIAEWIERGEIECGFLTATVPFPYEFYPVMQDRMMALCSNGHALARKEFITMEELIREPFITQPVRFDTDVEAVVRPWMDRMNIAYALEDDFSVMAMVSGNFGVSVMPELMLRVAKYDLEVRPLFPVRYRKIGIAALPADQCSPATRAFIEFSKEFHL